MKQKIETHQEHFDTKMLKSAQLFCKNRVELNYSSNYIYPKFEIFVLGKAKGKAKSKAKAKAEDAAGTKRKREEGQPDIRSVMQTSQASQGVKRLHKKLTKKSFGYTRRCDLLMKSRFS